MQSTGLKIHIIININIIVEIEKKEEINVKKGVKKMDVGTHVGNTLSVTNNICIYDLIGAISGLRKRAQEGI